MSTIKLVNLSHVFFVFGYGNMTKNPSEEKKFLSLLLILSYKQLTTPSRKKNLPCRYDYLVDLGVNAVYFTPVFDSGTHGYDTYDYFRIDRRLGTMEDFKAVLSELHDRGIRVVLDGVFNHTGRGHFAFSDILSRGKDWRKSPYCDW